MWLRSTFALPPALVLGDPCSGPGCDVLWFEGVLFRPPQHLDKQWAVQRVRLAQRVARSSGVATAVSAISTYAPHPQEKPMGESHV